MLQKIMCTLLAHICFELFGEQLKTITNSIHLVHLLVRTVGNSHLGNT